MTIIDRYMRKGSGEDLEVRVNSLEDGLIEIAAKVGEMESGHSMVGRRDMYRLASLHDEVDAQTLNLNVINSKVNALEVETGELETEIKSALEKIRKYAVLGL
jgi:predicted  nucleic acid-binding Zn-ribbon protein